MHAQIATRARFAHVLTAHTLDDQAETVLFRLARGSGLFGLTGMAHAAPLPLNGVREIFLVRPLLHLPKARLVATLRAARIAYAEDRSNHDPAATGARLRSLMPALAREGLDARGLAAGGAAAARRIDHSIRPAGQCSALVLPPWPQRGPIIFATAAFAGLPAETWALRLLGEAVAYVGDEGLGSTSPSSKKPYEALRQCALPPAPDLLRKAHYARPPPPHGRTRTRAAQVSHAPTWQEPLYEIGL